MHLKADLGNRENESAICDGISLVDYPADMIHCTCVSDLHTLTSNSRHQMALAIREIETGAFSLRSWNDALEYIGHQPKEDCAEKAKAKLIAALESVA